YRPRAHPSRLSPYTTLFRSTIGQHFTLIAESLDDTLATPDPLCLSGVILTHLQLCEPIQRGLFFVCHSQYLCATRGVSAHNSSTVVVVMRPSGLPCTGKRVSSSVGSGLNISITRQP